MENYMADLPNSEEECYSDCRGTTPKPLYDLCLVDYFDTTSVTFINHLLVFHLLQANEDLMLVPLIYSYFWVQVHYLPPGHRDCFFPILLTREVNEFDMGWDMSLRVVGRRVTIVDSVWLQKENVGGLAGGVSSDRATSSCLWTSPLTKTMSSINQVLGFNLERVALGDK
ncbi:hypothetical protein Goklo_029133 [Gossypium klotzschianum]|uniref:Uncharacterized protein n=1 Tax=Gossypium klotzschianum TaxID=34286 RepID=A0A7J8W4P2_9ROSI|nr:hypothetical protein [Gossypium klotzschianum]